MSLDFTVKEMWYLRNKMEKGKIHCQARATEMRGGELRVLGSEYSLGEHRRGMCVLKE